MLNIILLDRKHGISRTLNIGRGALALLLVIFLLLPATVGVGAYWLAYRVDGPIMSPHIVENWLNDMQRQKAELERTSADAEERLTALTVRMAEMQARLVRLDALGERLIRVARLPHGEFDFSAAPPMGGPDMELEAGAVSYKADFLDSLLTLSHEIERREEQLTVLESLMSVQKQENDTFLAGRPVRSGWLSSRYGIRNDPFSGRLAHHAGVDFASREGADVVATASGVITWAGKRYGYGLMIEISHGNGYATRYGHANEVLVSVGDIVQRGQTIGRVGSTGRSTGPHVHYEVLLNGKQVNPERYIQRASR